MMPHLRYLRYVLRHKWFVLLACRRLGVPLRQAVLHDWSKFLPVEWFPYVRFFYGPRPIRRDASGYYDAASVGGGFDRAWLHHQHCNAHRWQHWLLHQDDGTARALPMPERFAREMVADWIGAGRAQGKPDTRGWYAANKDRLLLHPDTRRYVERLLERL